MKTRRGTRANDAEAAIAATMSELPGAKRVGAIDNLFFRWPTPRELAARIAQA